MQRHEHVLEWILVKQLVGRTLPARASDHVFTIREVTDDSLTADSSTYASEQVGRDRFESIWRSLARRGQITFAEVHRISDRWWAGQIAFGTLAQMPRVKVLGEGAAAELVLELSRREVRRHTQPDQVSSVNDWNGLHRGLFLLPGQVFGRYRILEEIGRGGMGRVYKAQSLSAGNRLVAIKTAGIEEELNVADIRRFRREVKTLEKLTPHPHVVALLKMCKKDDPPFFVMELAELGNLRTRLVERPVDAAEGRVIFESVCAAVSFAHSQRVIHRDLKPENVLQVKRGVWKVSDFGLCKNLDASSVTLTKTGEALGTMYYLSPEQLRDAKNVGPRADIYSLGVMLYELITGLFPPVQLKDLPGKYRWIVERATEKDPAERFEDVEALRDAVMKVYKD